MPEPTLFWLTVILFSAAIVVGLLALSRVIRYMAMRKTELQGQKFQKRTLPPQAHA
jgi:hypothetical protein